MVIMQVKGQRQEATERRGSRQQTEEDSWKGELDRRGKRKNETRRELRAWLGHQKEE